MPFSNVVGEDEEEDHHLAVRGKKHEMMLNLSLSGDQKSGNIFVADQTPTPTRLIEKCEEVGLFEDLRHVNPFEETFRRAVEEQKSGGGQTPTCCGGVSSGSGGGGGGVGTDAAATTEAHAAAEESLHTPQVFPQLELPNSAEVLFRSCGGSKTFESPPTCGAVTLDETVPITDVAANMLTESYKLPTATSRQNSGGTAVAATCLGYGKIAQKYRSIAEKPPTATTTTFMQLVQPQLITLSFPSSGASVGVAEAATSHKHATPVTAIPVQTVKPYILPKLGTTKYVKQTPPPAVANANNSSSPSSNAAQQSPVAYSQHTVTHEPSSASLTPTSQLPIKERLKAILSNSSKSRLVVEATPQPPPPSSSRTHASSSVKTRLNAATAPRSHSHKYDGDCMQRKRAAATRYRDKIRIEHKELRRRNVELLAENAKLRERVAQLERGAAAAAASVGTAPAQIQIPSSTLHLVMNIPQFVVPSTGQPMLQTPITYRVEKK